MARGICTSIVVPVARKIRRYIPHYNSTTRRRGSTARGPDGSPASIRCNAGLFEPQRWTRYAYALNSPGAFVDPSGPQAQRIACRADVDFCTETEGKLSPWAVPTTGLFFPTFPTPAQRPDPQDPRGPRRDPKGRTPPQGEPPVPAPPAPVPPIPAPPVPPPPIPVPPPPPPPTIGWPVMGCVFRCRYRRCRGACRNRNSIGMHGSDSGISTKQAPSGSDSTSSSIFTFRFDLPHFQ